MKKYGSVFMLYNRMILYRVLLVFAGMGILEVLFLVSACQRQKNYCYAVEAGGVEKVFFLFLLLLTAIFCTLGCTGRGEQRYSLWRLRISEWGLFWCRLFVSLLYYFLFWTFQVGICYGMGLYFMHVKGMDSPQSTVIAFYADNFLHRLFPLEAYHIWAWNFVLTLGLLIVSAAFSFYWQRRKFYYPIILFFFLAFLLWDCDHVLDMLAGAVVMLALCVLTLRSVWKRSDIRED